MGDPGLTGLAGSLSKATGAVAGVADGISKVRGGVWVACAAHIPEQLCLTCCLTLARTHFKLPSQANDG